MKDKKDRSGAAVKIWEVTARQCTTNVLLPQVCHVTADNIGQAIKKGRDRFILDRWADFWVSSAIYLWDLTEEQT